MPVRTDFQWLCCGCGSNAPLDSPFQCPDCGEPRCIRPVALPGPEVMTKPQGRLWNFAPLLPVFDERNRVSLGEGGTPLVDAARLGKQLGFASLHLKNETANPTGSFKDRQIAVGISHAMEIGARTVAVVSSGNVAAATAAYAAHAGIQAVLFMHGQASPAKISQAGAYGPRVLCVQSPAPSEVFKLCLEACAAWGWYHLSTAGMYEPYNVEGAKTIAYELYAQHHGDLPDWLVMPVGGGGLFGGVWRGLLDLQRMGCIKRLPRLVGVQAAGCAPLKQAIDDNLNFLETLQHPWPDPKTVAGGIADDILFDGHTALPALRETGGLVITVTDEEIQAALKRLATTEGVLCELTSAVVPAALEHLRPHAHGQRVGAVITGHGIKELPWLTKQAVPPPSIEPTLEAVQREIGNWSEPIN